MTKPPSPTEETYDSLNHAHDFFNARLFGGTLPACLVTLQRRKKTYGFFAGQRFGLKTGQGATDEIALNPSHFEQRTIEQTLSTLAHEMAHQWQQHHRKPSRTGYHNKEWAAKMIEVGLVPSSTGEIGGKQVGQHMTHYIADGGAFAQACADLLTGGQFGQLYINLSFLLSLTQPFVSMRRRPSNRRGAPDKNMTPFVPDAYRKAAQSGAVKEGRKAIAGGGAKHP